MGMTVGVGVRRRCAAGLCLVVWLFLACGAEAATRVLFVGNSFTYVGGGIDKQLEGLVPSVSTSRQVGAGYTLARHWSEGKALQAIRAGGWSFVVLQEQSQTPVFDRPAFLRSVREFSRAITAAKAQTILLMTWERPDSVGRGVTTARLAAAYVAVGGEVGAAVAPAGLAFARSLSERPDLALYSQDGHPTPAGAYLAGCVLAGTITARSPVGNPYVGPDVPPELRLHLQRAAAASLGY